MIKQIARIDHTIGNRVFHFMCEHDAPIHEIVDSLYKFLGVVSSIQKTIQEQAAPVEMPPVVKTDATE